MLVDLTRLEREYYQRRPDVGNPNQLVSFSTSGHRGPPLRGTFTEAHILAITQAICDYRRSQGTDGPLYMGKDTHALLTPLVEALAHPDETCRRAAVEHVVRTCIPAVIGRLIERLVDLLDGAGTTRRQALASLAQSEGRAVTALTLRFTRTPQTDRTAGHRRGADPDGARAQPGGVDRPHDPHTECYRRTLESAGGSRGLDSVGLPTDPRYRLERRLGLCASRL
jgi:hypothetical protein